MAAAPQSDRLRGGRSWSSRGAAEGILKRVRTWRRRGAAALLLHLLLHLLDLETGGSRLLQRVLELLALSAGRHGKRLVARGVASLDVGGEVLEVGELAV